MKEKLSASLLRAASGKARLDSIQLLRGAAAVMVVWWHAVENIVNRESTYKAAKETFLAPRELYALGASGVDIFFVISGFVMLYSMWDGFGGSRSPLLFLKKRLYPYFSDLLGFFAADPGFHGCAPPLRHGRSAGLADVFLFHTAFADGFRL